MMGSFSQFHDSVELKVFLRHLSYRRRQALQDNGYAEAATAGVLLKKVFLEISQNSQENTCVRVSFLIKLQALGLQLY